MAAVGKGRPHGGGGGDADMRKAGSVGAGDEDVNNYELRFCADTTHATVGPEAEEGEPASPVPALPFSSDWPPLLSGGSRRSRDGAGV